RRSATGADRHAEEQLQLWRPHRRHHLQLRPLPSVVAVQHHGRRQRPLRGELGLGGQPPRRSRGLAPSLLYPLDCRASINFGTTLCTSPTTPRSATEKIGASLSLLMAMMFLAPFMPTRCCVAPEMPAAM